MLWKAFTSLVAASTASAAVLSAAKCNQDLQVDDFANFANAVNSLNDATSDDQSMSGIVARNGVLQFTPKDVNSYFYESFPCVQATSQGYGGFQFTITYPQGADFTLEVQTKSACSADSYKSEWFAISGLTGTQQVVTLDLNVYSTSNLDAIVGFVFAGFSKVGEYSLSDLKFVCRSLETRSASKLALPPELLRRASSAVPTSTRKTIITTTTYVPKPTSLADCQDLLIDDWESQSRLTFLYYNSMFQPSSDDGSMKSIVVHNDNTVSLAPQSADSYFYSQMPCVDATQLYGGISMNIQAAAHASFAIQLASVDQCGSSNFTQTQTRTTDDLGWQFDGTLQAYHLPLDRFPSIDPTKISMIYFSALTQPVTLGPMAFYCGDQPRAYPPPSHPVNYQSQFSVPAPAGGEGTLLIDDFRSQSANALSQWHGCDEDCVPAKFAARGRGVALQTDNADLAWYSSLADKCADITAFADSYLHVAYSGSNKFSIALQQANADCNPDMAPYPETWDSVEAARYATKNDMYIPLSHFHVDLGRVTSLAFKGFYTKEATTLRRLEIVPAIPDGFQMPNKLPTGNLVFACKRPNSFAFAIDDGDPALAQEVMEIVKSEGIAVTFFTVGLPLEDASTNLSAVYLDMQARGHQIAMHSFTHPKMEGLADYAAIDWEYNNDMDAVARTFAGLHTPYFRPPFGTEGARMRQRLTAALNNTDPYIVMWSVDVEDWKWGTSDTPEKQLDAFKRDLARGGNLVVMHYLYPNTVKYLRQFIRLAKATGKRLMRVDQCMMDPRAPPLDDE